MGATAEVRIQRQRGQPKCDVVVVVGRRQMVLTLPDYERALRWAQMECKTYRIPGSLPIVEIFEPVGSTA